MRLWRGGLRLDLFFPPYAIVCFFLLFVFFFFGLCCDTLFVLIASVYFSEVGIFCFRKRMWEREYCIVAGYWKYVGLYFLGGYI